MTRHDILYEKPKTGALERSNSIFGSQQISTRRSSEVASKQTFISPQRRKSDSSLTVSIKSPLAGELKLETLDNHSGPTKTEVSEDNSFIIVAKNDVMRTDAVDDVAQEQTL